MPPTPTRADHVRRTETPNAVMTTLASPTLGPTAELSLWRVAMTEGQAGPLHRFDCEQVWTVLDGSVQVTLDDAVIDLGAGDTLVVPADLDRRVSAQTDAELLVAGRGDAIVSVPGEQAPRGTPPWIA